MSHVAWLQQAESDLQAAKLLSDGSHHSQAVWLAAQAAEKAHKAILVALGLRYEDKHFKYLGHNTAEILKLLPEALHEPIDPQVATVATRLESRARGSRYPAPAQKTGARPGQVVAPVLSMTGSQQDLDDAKLLLDWCRKRVTRALRAVEAMRPQRSSSNRRPSRAGKRGVRQR